MSRTREVGRSILSTLASQVVSVLAALAFFAYFGRTLPKAEMALFAFVGTLSSWIELISNLGLGTMTIRDVPRLIADGQLDYAKQLISSTIFYRTAVSVFVVAGLVLLAPILSRSVFTGHEYTDEFRLIAITAFFQQLAATFSLMQWALQRFHIRAICEVSVNLGARVLAVVAYFLVGIKGFLLAFGLGSLIVCILQAWTMRDQLVLQRLPLVGLLRRSKTYIGVDILRNLMMNLDRPLVGFILGDVALANYYVAKRMYDFITAAAGAVVAPTAAKLSEIRAQGLRELQAYFEKNLFLMAILFVPLGCVVIGMGGVALQLLVGAKYDDSAVILACFGITIGAQATYQIWREGVWRLLAPGYLMVHNIILAGVTFVMYWLLLPRMGPVGLPLSAATAYWVTSGFSAYVLKRNLGLTGRVGLLGRAMACGLMVLVSIRLVHVTVPTVLAVPAMLAVAAASYGLGVYLFAPPDIKAMIRRITSRVWPVRLPVS